MNSNLKILINSIQQLEALCLTLKSRSNFSFTKDNDCDLFYIFNIN